MARRWGKNTGGGAFGVVALVFWALAVGIIVLVALDAFEKFSAPQVSTDVTPRALSPAFAIGDGDGRV